MLDSKTLEELNGVEIYEEFLGETDPFNSDKSHPKIALPMVMVHV